MKNKNGFKNMYLNMLRALVDFMFNALNIGVTNSITPFKNGATIIKNDIAFINDLRTQAKAVIKGIAAQKRSLRTAVTSLTYSTMKSVFAFAVITGNEQLMAAMNITKRHLNRMKMAPFMDFVQAAIDTITPLLGSLTDYNVTQQTIDNWQDILDQLENIDAAPTNAIKHRKMLNDQAADLLNQTLTYLRDVMDPLSLNFEETQNAYFREYLNNRRLTNISVHTKFKITLTNELNQPQVNVQLIQNGTANKTFTGINGQASLIVKVNEGPNAQPIYYFSIGTGPTAIQTGPVEIKRGHTTTRSYVIQPDGFIIPAPQNEPSPENA